MAETFLAWEFLLLQERARHMDNPLERRMLRDAESPFELPNYEFMDHFCISPDLAMKIIWILRPHLEQQCISGLSPEVQVLMAVSFYAHGSYQRPAGAHFVLAISQLSASRCIRRVTDLINNSFLRKWIKFPMTQEARQKFVDAPQPFPGVIGAIDCTYIQIIGPKIYEAAYINYHGDHCLNIQAIVDLHLKVLNINARFPGVRNDSYIWQASPLRDAMKYLYEQGERQTWIIADAGYPLEPWLMTPLAHYPENTQQFKYTEQLCKARCVVERFFGVLKGMCRCLSYQRVLYYQPDVTGKVVNACAVLHNMRLAHRLPVDNYFDSGDIATSNRIADNNDSDAVVDSDGRRTPRAVGQRIQKQIMRDCFPNM